MKALGAFITSTLVFHRLFFINYNIDHLGEQIGALAILRQGDLLSFARFLEEIAAPSDDKWVNDPLWLIARKLARHVASSRPALWGLERVARVLEQRYPSPTLLRPLYRWLIGGYIFRGYREGLSAVERGVSVDSRMEQNTDEGRRKTIRVPSVGRTITGDSRMEQNTDEGRRKAIRVPFYPWGERSLVTHEWNRTRMKAEERPSVFPSIRGANDHW
jgi:hypothetical protein